MEQVYVLSAGETLPSIVRPPLGRTAKDARVDPDRNLLQWTRIERPVLAPERQFGDRLGVERQMMG